MPSPVAGPLTLDDPGSGRRAADEWRLTGSTAAAALADVGTAALALVVLELLTQAAIVFVFQAALHPYELPLDPVEPALDRVLLVPLIAFRAVVWSVTILAIVRFRKQSAGSLGLRRDALGMNILIGIGSTFVVYGLILLAVPLLWMLWPGRMEENVERILRMVPKLHPLGFAGLTLAIGVYEELVFRGFFMTRLRRATGSWIAAVAMSTAVFTGLHALDQTAPALVLVAILSLVLSLVAVWRRSIVPGIVTHALFNLSQFLGLYVQMGDAWT